MISVSVKNIVRLISFVCLLLLCMHSMEQKKDSTKTVKKRTNIFQTAMNAIKKSKPDSLKQASFLNAKSESPFRPYEGKGIRHIIIKVRPHPSRKLSGLQRRGAQLHHPDLLQEEEHGICFEILFSYQR